METLLAAEIASQPTVLARLIEGGLATCRQIVADLKPCSYVLIAARGTSDHAATYAQYVWGSLARRTVALATPSLYTLYQAPPRMDGALVVGISQSGQSPDIVGVLEEGRRQGRPTLAITNDRSSPLARAGDYLIDLGAGPERSVAATKTYTAQLAAVALLAAAWSGDPAHSAALERLPAQIAATLEGGAALAARAERYRFMQQCVVIGRGYNYATALELALKLKELTYSMADAYSSADFRHGPIATVAPGLPVFLMMPAGAVFADMFDLAQQLRAAGAELLICSDERAALELATTPLPLPAGIPEWLSPLAAIVPGQTLALHLALARGLAPDQPRGLNKVTLTV